MGQTGYRGLRLAMVFACLPALAGCGERKEDTGTVTSAKAPPRSAKVSAAGTQRVTLTGALKCLEGKGLKVSRSGGGRGGPHLEVRTSGGNVSVYVYASRAKAMRRREAIAVGSKTSGGAVSQIGNALTVGSEGVGSDVTAKVRACLRA
jgi:hypothetical protein